MMKYSKQIILLLTLFFPLIISAQSFATFTPDPLFDEIEILPGDEPLGRVITVTNPGDAAEEYFLAAGSISNLSMSEDVWITIAYGGAEVFDASVFDLSQEPLSLGVISAGDTKEFEVSAAFLPKTDNYAQGQRLAFVVIVGNESGQVVVSGSGPSSGGGSGGGGGLLPDQLQIYDTRVDSIEQNPNGYDVIITWLTNLLADSRVVFGSAGESYQLDPTSPGLGYPVLFQEAGTRTAHSVIIPSLAPGLYRYRVASYLGGIPSVSPEYQFEITPEGELAQAVLGAFTERQDTKAPVGVLPQLQEMVRGVFDRSLVEEDVEVETSGVGELFPATATSSFSSVLAIKENCEPLRVWVLMLLTVLFGLLIDQLLRLRTSLGVGYRVFVGVAVVVTGFLSYLFPVCSWLPAIVMFTGILIVVWMLTLRKIREK